MESIQKSESIINLSKGLALFHIKVGTIKKDAKNPFFKSTYASLSNILDQIADPLAESGLIFTQLPTGENELVSMLIHADTGEYIQSCYSMKPVKDDPQGRGSVITYQRRYALSAILGLNIDADDDANEATHGGSTPEKATQYAAKVEEDKKPWLNETDAAFAGAVEKIKAGKSSITALRAYFKISKAVEGKLMDATKKDLQPA
jgi:hypothetical protein